jgi:hypothetical protein
MTARMEDILGRYNIPSDNRSVGLWSYDESFEKDLEDTTHIKLFNERKLIPKYCSVYSTIGEKRLGTHLLQGLDILLYEIFKISVNGGCFARDALFSFME